MLISDLAASISLSVKSAPRFCLLFTLAAFIAQEIYFRDREMGVRQDRMGGWGFLVHPTIVWGPSEHWLLFGLVSIPVAQDYRDRAQEEHWRLGFGATYLFAQ